MSGSRDGMLRRIRGALEAGGLRSASSSGGLGAGGSDGSCIAVPRKYRRQGERARDDVLDLFVQRLSDYHATVVREDSAALPEAIARILSQRRAGRLAVPADLPEAWLSAVGEGTLEVLRDGGAAAVEGGAAGTPSEAGATLSKGRLASVHGVLTGCALAVAETGTIILDSGPLQGRRVLTLLPDYHLCVVLAHQVVELVPEAVARLGEVVVRRGAPLTLVSGPSATSDIELQRVEGVHGPRTLDVILVEGNA